LIIETAIAMAPAPAAMSDRVMLLTLLIAEFRFKTLLLPVVVYPSSYDHPSGSDDNHPPIRGHATKESDNTIPPVRH
ncbi:hypothetical protein, partial [Vibrio anguillarum]|uniref:hypothetical protein n=1 Tax=Vibrio anguillarum TaxID=55601 RepID=UPI00188D3766